MAARPNLSRVWPPAAAHWSDGHLGSPGEEGVLAPADIGLLWAGQPPAHPQFHPQFLHPAAAAGFWPGVSMQQGGGWLGPPSLSAALAPTGLLLDPNSVALQPYSGGGGGSGYGHHAAAGYGSAPPAAASVNGAMWQPQGSHTLPAQPPHHWHPAAGGSAADAAAQPAAAAAADMSAFGSGPQRLSFMPVSEAGGRQSSGSDASETLQGAGGSTDSLHRAALGSPAAANRLPGPPSPAAAASCRAALVLPPAHAADASAAQAAAAAACLLGGGKLAAEAEVEGEGEGGGTPRHQLTPPPGGEQLSTGLAWEDRVDSLFEPDDHWLQAHHHGTPPPLQPGTSNTTLFEPHAPNPSSAATPPISLAQLPPLPDGLALRPGLSEVMAALHSISQHPMMRLLAQPPAATAAAATAAPAAVPTTPLGAAPAAAARLHLHQHEEAEEAAADTAAALQALDCADLLPPLPPQLGQRQAQPAQQYEAAGARAVQVAPSATAAGQALEAAFGQRWQLLLEGAADASLACASAGGAKPAVGASEAQQPAGRRTSSRARRGRASSPAELAGAEAAGQGSGPAGSGGGGGGSQQPGLKSDEQAAAGAAAGLPAGRKRKAAEDEEQGAESGGGQQAAAPAAQPKRQRAASAAATAVSAALATTARTVAALLQPLAGGGGPLPLYLPTGAGASRQEKLLLQQQQHLAAQLAVHAAAASLAAAVQRPHAALAAAAGASRQGAAAASAQVPHVPPHLTKTSCYRGVSWCKRRSLWEAAISIDGKRERLGFYTQEAAAARAYDTVAVWRNEQLRLEREACPAGSSQQPRRRRPKESRIKAEDGCSEGEGEERGEAKGEEGQATRRNIGQPLPLNLPLQAPRPGSGSLEAVLEELRASSKLQLLLRPKDGVQQPEQQQQQQQQPEKQGQQQPPSRQGARTRAASGSSAPGADARPASASRSRGGAAAVKQEAAPAAAAAAEAAAADGHGTGQAALLPAAAVRGAPTVQAVPVVKSSRYQGVCLCGNNRRWQAQVTFKRKRHYLGMHVSEEAAARAYDQGAICLLGTAAATNFPLSMYDVQTLTSQDITQVAARLKARKRGGRGSSASISGGRKPRSGGKRKRAGSDSESCGETEVEEEGGEGDEEEEDDEDEELSEEEEESL
ncbi:AP2-like ethylene-responsive transcription factor AIL5 [Chlorella vulgaris]